MNAFDQLGNHTSTSGLMKEQPAAAPQSQQRKNTLRQTGIAAAFLALALVLAVKGSPPLALMAGILFALGLGNPLPNHGALLSKRLLQGSVVLLGFGMNLPTVLRAGANGVVFAALTIGTTLALGYWTGRKLSLSPNTAALVSAGTAICGGSRPLLLWLRSWR